MDQNAQFVYLQLDIFVHALNLVVANIEIAPNNQFLAQRLRASGAYAEAERLEWGAEAILAGAVELANRASGLFWFNLRSVGVEPLAFYPPLWWFNMPY